MEQIWGLLIYVTRTYRDTKNYKKRVTYNPRQLETTKRRTRVDDMGEKIKLGKLDGK